MKIQDQLILHEGKRLKPYKDTKGKWTVGVGRNFSDVQFTTRELVDLMQGGITDKWCLMLLDNDLNGVLKDLSHFNWFDVMSDTRKKVIIDMVFNLGIIRFKGFKKTIDYLSIGNYEMASIEMLDSKWQRIDVSKSRSHGLSFMLKNDMELEYYVG